MPHFIKNNHGFSMIEILIALVICAMGTLGIVGFTAQHKKMVTQEKLMTIQQDFIAGIEDSLAVSSVCSRILKAAAAATSFSGGATGAKIALNPQAFSDGLTHPIFKFSAASVSYVQDVVIDRTDWVGARNYNGFVTVDLDFTDPTMITHRPILRQAIIPVVLFDEKNEGKWSGVQCASGRSGDSHVVGQICNLYGGTLTDGVHCDFHRVTRLHVASAKDPTMPVLADQTSTNRIRRIYMGDILCYLDTLIVMSPNNPLYSQRTATRFCKHPGKANFSNVSKDVRDIFLEIR